MSTQIIVTVTKREYYSKPKTVYRPCFIFATK